MSLPDLGPIRATEREQCVLREYFDGGLVRATVGLRPTSHYNGSAWVANVNDYVDAADGVFDHAIYSSSLVMRSAAGARRFYPTRGDFDSYIQIGRPYNVATRTPYPLNAFTRSGNLLTSVNSTANIFIWHGGHFSKLGIELKGSWKTNPPAQVAFPVDMVGLTWNNGVISSNGVPVMGLSAPVAYDMDNPDNRRAMTWSFPVLDGQRYLVLDLPTAAQMTGWLRPFIDPTLTLTPDSTAGLDTFIAEATPTTNFGTNVELRSGESNTGTNLARRTLIKFDFSTLPDAALISSSKLRLYALTDLSSNSRAHEIYLSLRVWTEAGATWNKYDGTSDWATAGGAGSGDIGSLIGTLTLSATETLNVYKEWPLSVTTKTQLGTLGWIIKAQTELNDGYNYASSDAVDSATRPECVTIYTLPSLLLRMNQHAAYRRR